MIHINIIVDEFDFSSLVAINIIINQGDNWINKTWTYQTAEGSKCTES